MKIRDQVLGSDERAVFGLRELYGRYGYSHYRMSKFEEYELYVRNKNFLISDHIITFTDNGGRLMALKPDVTLSIVKNSRDAEGEVSKVYYNENVYRVTKGSESYKEIMQVGLECIGDIDGYHKSEVLMLAMESLKQISGDFVLDVSHLGVLSAALDATGAESEVRASLLHCVGEKNLHGISAICLANGIDESKSALLRALVSTYGEPSEVIEGLLTVVGDGAARGALSELSETVRVVSASAPKGSVRIDFSVINDMSYYNGIVFRGFINGIPTGILSGGQYDLLMKKMGKKGGAMGFAVYPELLSELSAQSNEYDVDTVLIYDDGADVEALHGAIRMLTDSGRSVMALRSVPQKLRYRQLLRFKERGVEIVEANA